MSENNYTVYIHIFPNHKCYVGITKQKVNERWGGKGNGYKTQPVYKAICKYGWDNIQHIVVAENVPVNEARKMEIDLIKKYNSIENGYNIGRGGDLGSIPSFTCEYKGKIYTSKELAELSSVGLSYHDITNRINEHGWDIETTLNKPKTKKNTKFEYNGEELTIKQLYKKRVNRDLSYKQILSRLLKGWDIERAITQPNNVRLQPHGVGERIYEYKGKMYNSWELTQISSIEGLKPSDITNRVHKHGWTVERAISQPKRKKRI